MLTLLFERLRRRRRRRRARCVLASLDDRTLADIGLRREELDSLARPRHPRSHCLR